MLDPWRLRLLTLLESLGTVRAVATAARLSPSSVSEQLAVLEREASAELFERAGRRLRLTPAGVVLARHARLILDQMDAAREELSARDGRLTGTIRLGGFTSALNTFVLTALRDLARRHPLLRVTLWELDPSASVTALRRGDCDVIVTSDPAGDGVVSTRLAEDDVVLVTAADQPDPVDLAELRAAAWSTELPGMWCHTLVMDACRRAGFEPGIAGLFASYGPMLAHIEAGLSVTLLPQLAVDARYRVRTRPLRDPIRRTITAAVRTGSADRPTIRAVVEALTTATT